MSCRHEKRTSTLIINKSDNVFIKITMEHYYGDCVFFNRARFVFMKGNFDVIWENPAIGGTQRTGSEQTPGLSVTYEHLQKALFSVSAQFKKYH